MGSVMGPDFRRGGRNCRVFQKLLAFLPIFSMFTLCSILISSRIQNTALFLRVIVTTFRRVCESIKWRGLGVRPWRLALFEDTNPDWNDLTNSLTEGFLSAPSYAPANGFNGTAYSELAMAS